IEKLMNEIGELRAISSHVLGAFGVQIPQNNLDNLRSTVEEEDGETKVLDPQDVSGFVLLEIMNFAIIGEEADWSVLWCEGCNRKAWSSDSSCCGTKRLPKSSD
nr:hypothetical protein [Tanacetum cinerariifolium]